MSTPALARKLADQLAAAGIARDRLTVITDEYLAGLAGPCVDVEGDLILRRGRAVGDYGMWRVWPRSDGTLDAEYGSVYTPYRFASAGRFAELVLAHWR